MLIAEGLYDKAFVARWCHGFDELAERAAQYPPAVAAGASPACRPTQIVAAARMYADGPSTFVSGHGIDAFSAGVQTFRAYHCLVAISGNVDRPGGNLRVRTPKGFKNYIDLLHMPEFRLDAEIEQRTIGADRFPLWAGPKGWQTACHNPSVIEAMLTGKPYPVRALYASGVNILVTYPDTRRTMEALRSLDFVAVAAHAMTPTAEFADIVLPKTTTLEEEEVSFMPSGPTVLFTRAVGAAAGRGALRDRHRRAAAREDGRRARRSRRHLLPWRSQREFNTYLLGDSGIRIEDLERTGYAQVEPRAPSPSARSRRRPARSSCYSTTMESVGLDPLPAYDAARAARPLPEAVRAALPADPRHRRPREELSPLALPRSGLGAEGVARSAPHHAPRHGARARPRRRRLGAGSRSPRGKGACRLRVKLTDATPPDVVNTGMGWWLPSSAGARARRARRQHQRRAALRRPLGPGLRLLRHPRPALPRRGHRVTSSRRRECTIARSRE